MSNNLKYLLLSRKAWISFFGCIALIYIWFTSGGDMPAEALADNVIVIITVLVGSIALEDGLSKR